MAFIEIIDEGDAEGTLARVYASARNRADRVYNILKVQSRSPKALQACMALYTVIMKTASALSRAQREMLAVVVSRTNACHY